jgi:AcrR family transcriptional regulator
VVATDHRRMAGDEPRNRSDQRGDDGIPAWKRESVERSLYTATARAEQRSEHFASVAIQLMREQGSTDFTVQDVVDRSRMSIRTFYSLFAGKDDLLIAVHETILANEVSPKLRRQCDVESDPRQRVRVFVEGTYELLSQPPAVARALTMYRNRLAETRPGDLDHVLSSQIERLVHLIRAATLSGSICPGIDVDVVAHLLYGTVLAAVSSRTLAPDDGLGLTAPELWQFCSAGIGLRGVDG